MKIFPDQFCSTVGITKLKIFGILMSKTVLVNGKTVLVDGGFGYLMLSEYLQIVYGSFIVIEYQCTYKGTQEPV